MGICALCIGVNNKCVEKPIFSVVFGLFVILVFSQFGTEGWIWVLLASVPDRCILLSILISSLDMSSVIHAV